jgi:hypothetical protein
MDVGPVELIVLEFADQRADPAVAGILADAASRGSITVLDLVFVRRTPDGVLQVTDGTDNLHDTGLGSLHIRPQALISEGDLASVSGSVKAGTSAAVIVYEYRWTRQLASAAEQAGGGVALHVQVPRDILAAAMSAAVS